MKPLLACLGLGLVGAMVGPASGQVADDEKGRLPVDKPQDLWQMMPGEMETWELKVSTAESRFNRWLEARAVREYQKIETPEEAESGKPTPPAKTRIVVTDTAGFPGSIDFFEGFEPGKDEEDDIERRVLSGWPAFLIPYGDDELVVEILVAKRFLVEITLQHQPRRFVGQWVRRMDLGGLAGLPETEIVALPETVKVMRIDQLNPERNRAYLLATTSNSRVEQELQEDEDWVNGVIGEIPALEDSSASSDSLEPGEGDPESDQTEG